MDNKNTDKITQFEEKVREKNKKREKAVIITSAMMVLAALTLTGIYITNSREPQNPITENISDLQGDISGGLMQAPDLEPGDLQVVDSGTVENPGRTGSIAGTESTESTESTKKPASKSSNTLTGKTEAEGELSQDVLSGTVENMTLSFSGINMLWPVSMENEVLIPYSMDKAVYFETLDQYKYNPAMIISAEVGTPVVAVSAGRITGRYWDYETGWTYEMDLGGGFKAYYGQLDYMQKAEDTYVAEGDILGYIAEPTMYYSKEGSNLYFAMTKEDKPVYPMDYVGE